MPPSSKVRFDGLDVCCMVGHCQRLLLGRRVINIYDAVSDHDAFLLKLDANRSSVDRTSTTSTTSINADHHHQQQQHQQQQQPQASSKQVLFVESGIRFHITHQHASSLQQQQQHDGMPSPFCSKLRKHLRGLRLERVSQLGTMDRVVLLVFGSGTSRHCLVLELYARGNVILTDAQYTILALLRSHSYDAATTTTTTTAAATTAATTAAATTAAATTTATQPEEQDTTTTRTVRVQVGHVYPVTHATTTMMGNDPCACWMLDKPRGGTTTADGGRSLGHEAMAWARHELTVREEARHDTSGVGVSSHPTTTTQPQPRPRTKHVSALPLKALLLRPSCGFYHYGPSLLEHCILCANLDPTLKFQSAETVQDTLSVPDWERLVQALQTEGSRVIKELSATNGKGYILYRTKDHSNNNNDDDDDDDDENQSAAPTTSLGLQHTDKILQEFQPHLLKQHEGRPFLTYDSFSDAVDDFFAHIGGQKLAMRASAAEAAAKDKLRKIRQDQKRRVESLEKEQEKLKQHARLVELHAEDVDKALSVINSALDSGMDWEALEQLVETEQANQNPIALLIKRLDLENDVMVLALLDTFADDGSKRIDISVLLHESAYGNASIMFTKYRASKEKSQKTIEASSKALKAAEASAQRQLVEAQKKRKLTATMHSKRKPHWFEKFHWMITSDNYLVLGGRDAQQNELLVKRYLRPGDAYLHADVHGAASCILRAKRRRRNKAGRTQPLPLPEQALREAGSFTICRSSAWASRMVTSAWWVESHQVSKTAPAGEYLTVGSFMVRGKKNFLPPSQLEMGLAILFRLGDDDSIARHLSDRRDFSLLSVDEESDLEEADMTARDTQRLVETERKGDLFDHSHVSKEDEPDEADEPRLSEELVDRPPAEVALETAPLALTPTAETASTMPISSEFARNNGQLKQKKGLSKRDRKLIKKYGSLEAAEAAISERHKVDQSRETVSQTSKFSRENEAATTVPSAKRGKRSKMKRAAKKYGDQDEEERELALLALHAGELKSKDKNGKSRDVKISEIEKTAAEETAALLTKDPERVASSLPDPVRVILAECVTLHGTADDEAVVHWEKFDADALEQVMDLTDNQQTAAARRLLFLKRSTRVDNFSASLSGIVRTIRKYGHENLVVDASDDKNGAMDVKRKTKSEKRLEEEAWKETLAEEGIAEDDVDDDAIDDTIEMNKLTGKPFADDSILYAVPVCAPYQTLSQYKYRVKLTPGSQKRGKAAKQCVDMFLSTDLNKSKEAELYRELIKQIGDNDFVQVMCSDVKISAAGASKAAKKSKAGGKKNGKNKKK